MSSEAQQIPSLASPHRPVEHQDDLAAFAKSNRIGTMSDQPTGSRSKSVSHMSTIANQALLGRDGVQSAKPSNNLLREPETSTRSVTLSAGKSHRRFKFASNQLVAVSPYFRRALAEQQGHEGSTQIPGSDTFPEIDETAMELFSKWINRGVKLPGPHDFHSLHHYVALYVSAHKFEVEVLQNEGEMSSAIC
jgi:hypothetical protein